MTDLVTEIVSRNLQDSDPGCQSPLPMGGVIAVVIVCCVLGLIWAFVNVVLVKRINVKKGMSDKDSDSLSSGDLSEHQKTLLIELG